MPISRRTFLGTLATSLTLPGVISADEAKERWPLAFSTLGCPKWEWKTVLARASQWGYAAIELRGLNGQLDLTKAPELSGVRLAASLRDLQALDLKISDLGASTRLHEADPTVRAAQLDEGKRYIDLAHRLEVPFVRVFGDRVALGQPKQASVERVISGFRELAQHAQGSGVTVLLESHGDFCDSPTLLEILRGVAMPTAALLWDAHHTVVAGKEAPDFTLRQVGEYVRHVHLKDSKPEGTSERYVLTGQGTIPIAEIVRLLVARQFHGYYSFEWEKLWHPEIDEPETAFPDFAQKMVGYFRAAGLKPG